MTPVPLTECEAIIRPCDWGKDAELINGVLWFTWKGERHFIPYNDSGDMVRGQLVWQHVSGSTIEDLTLAPSYFAKAPEHRRLHCFIRSGSVHPV